MTTNNIHQDFIRAQKEFEPARKLMNNPFHKSKYADLSACIDAVKDALNNNNFYLKQVNHDCENGIAIETILVHSSGEFISSGVLRLPTAKNDPQGYGSAMTYARRYSLMAVCGIAPEDDDANSAKPPENKPILQQRVEDIKQSQYANKKQAKLKQEDLLLEAEKAASMGTESFRTWWSGNLTKEEKDILRNQTSYLQNKCDQADELNQDINQ